MVQLGFVKPSNGVVQGSFPRGSPFCDFFQIKTVANMYPGRLVIYDTDDHSIKVAGAAGQATGWLGYEETPDVYKPATRDTIYVLNDHAAVHSGGGFRIRASLASGQNVTKGQRLAIAAAGEVTAATDGTHHVVAIADESVDASGAAAAIWVRSLI